MKVTLKPGTEVETFTLDIKHVNESHTTMLEVRKASVFIEFFWDSHGNLVPFEGFNDKETFSKVSADVKIVSHKYTPIFKLTGIDNKEVDDWQLEIDSEVMNCSVYEYKWNPSSNLLKIKAVVGWG
jgi:hypothetical protein